MSQSGIKGVILKVVVYTPRYQEELKKKKSKKRLKMKRERPEEKKNES